METQEKLIGNDELASWLEVERPANMKSLTVSRVTDRRKENIDLLTHAEAGPSSRKANAEKEEMMKPQAAVTMTKRALDILIGLFGTALFLLAYPVLALLIKLESKGPALYLQSRVGRDRRGRPERRAREALPPGTERRWNDRRKADVGGRIFTIYKFRTMRMDAEKNGPQLCGKGGDPRVTRLGNILRSLHLDELPQFWNVLKGDMSFIGPRPERPHFTLQYAKKIPLYAERTRQVKPGLTGLSQIVLGYDDSLDSVIRKTHFDLSYRASMISFATWLRMEIWVIVNTAVYLLKRGPLGAASAAPSADPALRPQPAGLSMALVRYKDTLKPVLVKAHGRADFNWQVPEGRGEKMDVCFRPRSALALEDLDLIIRVTQRARKSGGQATVKSSDPRVTRFLSQTHLDKLVKVEKPQERVGNFMSIDVECWFHAHNLNIPKSEWEKHPTNIVDNVRRILDLLKAHDAKATFFVLGWVADRFPEVVRMIDAAGQEIGTHGYMHDKVTDMSRYEFEKDLCMSLDALARHTSRKIVGHRASNFSIVDSTLWALEIMARNGIEYDSSIFPIKRSRYGIPDYPNRMPHVIELSGGASIREVPLSTASFGSRALPVAGGGYLRLYPYALTDLFIRRRNAQGLPGMVYFHPWELDQKQKRLDVGPLKSFQHYVNLDTTETKIHRLLERFHFTSIGENLESDSIKALLAQNPVSLKTPAASAIPAAVAAAAPSASLSPSEKRLLAA